MADAKVDPLPYQALLAFAIACARAPEPPAPVLPFATDTNHVERIAAGVTRRYVYAPAGPWAVNVLDVNRDACYSAVAVKGFPGAAGRKKTTVLLTELDSAADVVGGVNADFFAPNGVPANVHVSGGRLITGPRREAALAFDSAGAPSIAVFQPFQERQDARPSASWNRPAANGLAIFDANWGSVTDTASGAMEFILEGPPDSRRVIGVDSATAGVPIPAAGGVWVFRGSLLRSLAARPLHEGLNPHLFPAPRTLRPFMPREAVGGRPALVRDSLVLPEVDSVGGAGFATTRHPRTAVGIANDGRRLILVVVDGRQKPYSDGMTLRELANLMLALGARDAINLDGGGSSTLVYSDPRSAGALRIANRPSDATGERAVGNALAIVRGCR
jgi:hypothetical protein